MAIEIYKSDNKNKILFTLDISIHEKLEQIFNQIYNKTGIYVDPYGTTRLSINHMILLKKLFDKELPNLKSHNNTTDLRCIIEFGTFISNALDENKEVIFEGD